MLRAAVLGQVCSSPARSRLPPFAQLQPSQAHTASRRHLTRSSAPEIATMQPCSRAICLPASSASAVRGPARQGSRALSSAGVKGNSARRGTLPLPPAGAPRRPHKRLLALAMPPGPPSPAPAHPSPVAAAVLSTPLVVWAAPARARISDGLPRTTVGLSRSSAAQIWRGGGRAAAAVWARVPVPCRSSAAAAAAVGMPRPAAAQRPAASRWPQRSRRSSAAWRACVR